MQARLPAPDAERLRPDRPAPRRRWADHGAGGQPEPAARLRRGLRGGGGEGGHPPLVEPPRRLHEQEGVALLDRLARGNPGPISRRPDIRQAGQKLVAANAQIGAAKALRFPTISLTGAYGTASRQLEDRFTGPSRVWSYAGSIAGPIFAGGAISAQVRQTEAARKAAELGYRAAIQSAFADVDDALVARQKLVEQLAAQGRLVAASREYARLARLQFDGGVAPYVTVLQAKQQLFPAELNQVQLRASLFASTVNVYKAMGGGWVAEAETLTR